jgi:cytidylate kinase
MTGNQADKHLVITIDGPAGSGKSTVAKVLAKKMSYVYLDTGALYRAVAWQAYQEEVSETDEDALAELCRETAIRLVRVESQSRVIVNGEDVSDKLRDEHIGMFASRISAFGRVREALLPLQHEMGKAGSIIAEGRDMGSVVFPNAAVKFYLDAALSERSQRRYQEILSRSGKADYEAVEKDLMIRDEQDRNRKSAPLRIPDDAVIIDTTAMDVQGVVQLMLDVVSQKIPR